ncbi:MAG: serine carboxypeptidase [Anaerolineales bacterium]|nr:serine carboxypeptidase [Anaerolineales bacterium]
MKSILVIHLGDGDTVEAASFLAQPLTILRRGCCGDPERARALIAAADGQVAAIGLDGLPAFVKLGTASRPHTAGSDLAFNAKRSPVVDGSGIRDGLERWAIILADRAQPGIFAQKRILMVPGLNHTGLAQSLLRRSSRLRYADPLIYFALPDIPGVGARRTLDQVAAATLDQAKDFPFRRLVPQAGRPGVPRASGAFVEADVLAGDIGAIRRYAPSRLDRKTVVAEAATEADLDDLQKRGVSIVVTLMPGLAGPGALGTASAAVIEAILVALRPSADLPLTENTYLDMISQIEWTPHVRYLRADDAGLNKFAFVIHPLNVEFIHQHRWLGWTRWLPDDLVEAVAACLPPLYLSRITGAQSPATGQRVQGYLLTLGATPRQMMARGERFTYKRLNQAARLAERLGARLMGLGAFTSVVGDAGITVAHEADIAITSGNSLTVAATLEAAKQAVQQMGTTDLTRGKAMVVGATGSIGAVCARLLAQAIYDVVLVSIEPEKLIDLKRRIRAETPGARVSIATRADTLLADCDLIVTATSAFGQRVVDITRCKPGAVICDVARPPDISAAEAALRPDMLVVESGEVLIPGDVDFGYDIGLPPRTSYACLAETALLAMEGRFEDYTLGRNIEIERVKEIYRLFKKHHFQLAGLRSHGKYLTPEEIARRRALAHELRADPACFQQAQAVAAQALARIPAMSKGIQARPRAMRRWAGVAAGLGVLGLWLWRPWRLTKS